MNMNVSAVFLLALAMFATCEALLILKDARTQCNDDKNLSDANKALLLSNQVDKFAANADIKSWLVCYYYELNILQNQPDGDTSEALCRKAFVAAYPSMWLGGNAAVNKCNALARNITNYNEKGYTFHKCLVEAGFKLSA